ncbi:MAG TPA: heme exporter protein CcmD [Acidimicrobiales bacterium]|nr:heme exporter protein CcmD [Acidimicrobiales bacterium]
MDVPTLLQAQLAVQNQTPSYWGYVIAGYGVSAAAIGGYVVHIIRRGRRLSRQVPTDKRRWL